MLPSLRRWARPWDVVRLPLVVLALSTTVGCGARDANDPSRAVATYSGRLADLFDDAIEPAAVGLDLDKGYTPRLDKGLRERALNAEGVLRVRVSTLTAKSDGPSSIFQIGLHTVEKLAGDNPPPADFTVQLTQSSASHGILKSFESRLVGYAFIAFVREFAQPNGDREIHFHLVPDTKDVKTAIGDALVMSELK